MRLKPLIISILLLLAFSHEASSKIRIDITSPIGKFPIAISEMTGTYGKEISGIIRDDLAYTGVFSPLSSDAFIEAPDLPFNPKNWTVIGAEAVLKGDVKTTEGKIIVTVYLYDLSDGTTILSKEYSAGRDLIRPLAHSIANDIYGRLTGSKGIFRTKIAFVAKDGKEKGLYISDWDGQRIKGLGIRATVLLRPQWSRDGSRLLYSTQRNGLWSICILDLGQAKETQVYTSKATLITGDFSTDMAGIVLSSSEKGTPDIYSYEMTTGEMKRLTSISGIEVSPTLSPDGGTIAFVSDMGGSPQIYMVDKNGYNTKRITYEGPYNTSPAWSHDGLRLVFVGRYEGRSQIYTVRPDGSDLKSLTGDGNNEDPSFSPDGRFIVFTSDRDGDKGVYIMRADGEEQKRITPKGMKASAPRWSPEGH